MKQTTQNMHRDAELLKALGHPLRLAIVSMLCSGECNVGRVVEQLGFPQSSISQQLAVLRAGGVIAPKREGTRTCYRICDDRVRRIVAVLAEAEESVVAVPEVSP